MTIQRYAVAVLATTRKKYSIIDIHVYLPFVDARSKAEAEGIAVDSTKKRYPDPDNNTDYSALARTIPTTELSSEANLEEFLATL